MDQQKNKWQHREKRHKRIRKNILGTAVKPRLSVYRSLNHLYAQLIDDTRSHTLLSVSTMSPEIKSQIKTGGNKTAADIVGQKLAKDALAKGIKTAVLDRGSYRFHGRVKAMTEAARKNGLTI
ncbi:MAG: 50S ribosomal protein L18 [Planctomycetes bacterium]|nr:50S ribosomal protein L18 [Planctomycetota bacterium]